MRSAEEQQLANEMYDRLRDDLLKRDLSNTENYDRSILTLSSAGLGLSISAIHLGGPNIKAASYIWLIWGGWTLFFFSIVTSLSAYLVGSKAIAVQLANAYDYYKKGQEDAFTRSNAFIRFNKALNISTGVLFVFALGATILFVSLNLSTEQPAMSKHDSQKTQPTPMRESANVPTMERISNGVVIEKSANIPTMERVPQQSSGPQQGSSSGSSAAQSNKN